MQPNQVAPRTWASRSKPARSRWLLRRSRGMLTKFERLINDGMDVNVLGSNGWTPLVSAAETRETNAVLFLHKHGANTNLADEIGSTPLMGVSSAGELAAVEAVVQHGAEVRAANRRKWTPLHVAARWGHYHVVKFLIKSRTDINAQTEMRNTPLRVAAIWGEVAVAGCLLRNGADVSISNSSGLTPLMEASRSGNIEIIEDLMRHGEEVHATPRRIVGIQSEYPLIRHASVFLWKLLLSVGIADYGWTHCCALPVPDSTMWVNSRRRRCQKAVERRNCASRWPRTSAVRFHLVSRHLCLRRAQSNTERPRCDRIMTQQSKARGMQICAAFDQVADQLDFSVDRRMDQCGCPFAIDEVANNVDLADASGEQ